MGFDIIIMIAEQLTGIDEMDMSIAEKQIAKILDSGYAFWRNEQGNLVFALNNEV
jgi:hypothetical protein